MGKFVRDNSSFVTASSISTTNLWHLKIPLLKIITISLILCNFIFDSVFADEHTDITKELAEKHENLGRAHELEAQKLASNGNFQKSADKFALAAKQYEESASYYSKLHDYLNIGKLYGRASFAYEEAAMIHSELHDFENSLLNYFLSDKFNAHSLYNVGIAKFGDTYLLPPKFQAFLLDDPHKIVCKNGLELAFNINDSPACVLHSTKIKLVERGWIKVN